MFSHKVEVNCKKCFNNLNANLHEWGNGDHVWDRSITRDYYQPVFDCGNPFPTNLISKDALAAWYNREETCTDHCFSPQFMGRYVMDNAEPYLKDYEGKFKPLFRIALTTIQVTARENTLLRTLTKHRNGIFKIKEPSHMKYNHLGIQLYKKEDKEGWDKARPTSNILNELIHLPEEFIEYEKKFLV